MNFFIFIGILFVGQAQAESPSRIHKACKADQDCRKVYGVCGSRQAIHFKFEKQVAEETRKDDELSSCREKTAEEVARDNRLQAYCLAGVCELK